VKNGKADRMANRWASLIPSLTRVTEGGYEDRTCRAPDGYYSKSRKHMALRCLAGESIGGVVRRIK